MTITRDDWLAAVAECTAKETDDPDAMTNEDLQALLGRSETQTRHYIRAMLKANKIVPATKAITAKDGRRIHVSAYRLVDHAG